MTQRKVSLSDTEWAAIIKRAALGESASESNILRAVLGLPLLSRGGIRTGGFEPGNQHSPRARQPTGKRRGVRRSKDELKKTEE